MNGSRIDNLYVKGRFQRNGFGTQLLQYAISYAGNGAYIVVPKTNKVLTHICEGLESIKNTEDLGAVISYFEINIDRRRRLYYA